MSQPKLSVIIITKNEEKNVKDCLDSVTWVDEIILVDDGSTDRTVEIASQYPQVKIFRRQMVDGFSAQKNFALAQTSGEWILNIDADERVTSELKQEILCTLPNSGKYCGYLLRRKHLVFGKFLLDLRPCVLRLFRKNAGYFGTELVHEKVHLNGLCRRMKNPLIHLSGSFSTVEKYINSYLNQYTTSTAIDLFRKGKRICFFNTGYYFLIKPVLIFFRRYFFNRTFIFGVRGLVLSLFSSFAYLISYVKLWELQQKEEVKTTERK